MNKTGLDYGKFLAEINWNYIATYRPHYELTTFSSDKKIGSLTKAKGIEKVFFSLETDYNPKMAHAHLLIKAERLERKQLAKLLNTNLKSVSYFQPVDNPKAVSYYCSKYIGKNLIHYNFFWK